MKALSLILIVLGLYGCSFVDRYQYKDSAIRINQVGYFASSKKQAIVTNPEVNYFQVLDTAENVVFEGKLLPKTYWDKSGEAASIADFSELKQPGMYYLSLGTGEIKSQLFDINDRPYVDLIKASIKAYYFNRASTPLDPQYSGLYQRPFSHPDTSVIVHASAASPARPPGKHIATPYGWYDAGDYNKYVVNSGITTYTLLMAYQHNKSLLDTLNLNIPESGNNQADILDEILWNVKWLETMQDPSDGGVYHKTTTAHFEGFVKASEATGQRFVTAKGTAAALNFSAVLAKTAHLLKNSRPDYAEKLLEKAEYAWQWALDHPNVPFDNPKSSDPDFPSISTGRYGDVEFTDEFFWAACELYLATGKSTYSDRITLNEIKTFRIPNWRTVETLGLISLSSSNAVVSEKIKKQACDRLILMAENLLEVWRKSPYKITLNDFRWGSNSDILNQGMVLVNAYRVFGNSEYYQAALSSLDYVLGRNAVGYCFVTGYGSKHPMHIHHRQSASDNIDEPIPGLLVGGPNPNNIKDDCGANEYPIKLPARCYIDEVCSYSTNEVAINWNAPLVYLSSSLQTIYLNDLN